MNNMPWWMYVLAALISFSAAFLVGILLKGVL